jgi:hypothetical protein
VLGVEAAFDELDDESAELEDFDESELEDFEESDELEESDEAATEAAFAPARLSVR